MKYKLKPLSEQVVVITGASSGIGLVTAKAAAGRGAKVMLVARNEDALRDAVREIEVAGGQAGYAVTDVGDRDAVRAAADSAVQRFGRIDTWINNAGVAIYAKLLETPLDEHEQLFRTNYFGVVNGATVAVEHLRAKGGALITVASVASEIPSPIMGAYAASKHATKAFIESLRIELMADAVPVSVTLVKPSGIDTPIAQHAADHGDGAAMIPPPVYDPELVATAILDAAEHQRRDVTVGGAGRAQVLFGTHFPRVFDLLAPFQIPQLFDRSKRQPAENNLFDSTAAGRERSGDQSPRQTSFYTAAQRHRPAAYVVATLGVAAVAMVARRARRG